MKSAIPKTNPMKSRPTKLELFLYRSYTVFYRLSRWRRRHITPAGTLTMTAIILSALLGFNIFRTQVYQIFALGFAIAGISFISSFFPFTIPVKINRILPDYVTAQAPMFYDIELTNESKKNQKGLILYEDLKDPRPGLNTLLTQKEPYEAYRNAWDKKTRYYRWVWLIRKNSKIDISPVELPDLPSGETIKIRINATPSHRGMIHFSGLALARPDIFGLFNRLDRIKKRQKLLVLPKRYPVRPPSLKSSRHYHAGGISLASSIGNSSEFMALRQYRPGDPLKNIHWRTFAKTQELVIREFEDEYFVRHALILDTFLETENVILFEEAVSIAASYIQSMQTHESILDLMFAGSQIYTFSSGRGLSHTDKMLEILAQIQPGTSPSVNDLAPALKANIKQFSGSICVFLDWNKGHQKIQKLFQLAQVPACIVIVTDDMKKTENKISKLPPVNPDQLKIVETDSIPGSLG